MFTLRAEPLLCGDEHNTQKTLNRTSDLYDLLEMQGRDVIHLGDIFHTKEKLSSKALNLVFQRLSESKLNHVLLVGNHDFHSLECEEHSLEIFKGLPNVLVVDRPTTILIGDTKALCFPYYHDLTKFREDLARANHTLKNSAEVLFLHQGITGFDYGNGFIAVDELDLASVKGFKKVISGHFHKFQQKGNLTYLGTPYSNDFGESNQEKFLGVLKTDLTIDLIPTDFPQHYTYTLDCSKNEQIAMKNDHFYRLILTGKKEDIELFPKDKYPRVKFIDRPDSIATNLQFADKLSNEAKFQQWAKDRIDTDTEKLGLEILSEVL